jgi:type IV secretory pathway TrbL component
VAESITPAEVSATIKYGEGFAAPWLVFKGNVERVKADIIASFPFEDVEELAGASLSEVVLLASQHATAAGNLSGIVGITKTGGGSGRGNGGGFKGKMNKGNSDAWTQAQGGASEETAAPEAPADPKVALIEALTEAEDLKKLAALWSENQAMFADPEVKKAYSTRGKALKAAAK